MRKELAHLIATVRDLGIRATGRPSPNCISVGAPTEGFPDRLLALAEALDAYDGAEAAKPAQHELFDDPEKLRRGFNAILRFMEVRGYDVEGAMDAAAGAMELRRKSRGVLKPVPIFSPRAWRKDKAFDPTFSHTPNAADLALIPDGTERGGERQLRKHAMVVDRSLEMLGAARPIFDDPAAQKQRRVSAP
jgi:hypothetical protein